MTRYGPLLQFFKAHQVLDTVWIAPDADETFAALQRNNVDGEWILEYCGVTFGSSTEDDLPVSGPALSKLFQDHHGSVKKFENTLTSYLPVGAEWRATEFRKYLTGHSRRFNAWIIVETPVRRIALIAMVLVERKPQEALLGYPVASKFRPATHSFFPVVIVDNSKNPGRVGWVWPCCHATLRAREAVAENLITCISR
jgi:hypothetical protein